MASFVQSLTGLERTTTATASASGWTVTPGNKVFALLYTGDQNGGGNTGDPTTPSGWNLETGWPFLGQGRFEAWLYSRVVDGSETGITIGLSSSCECSIAPWEMSSLGLLRTNWVFESSDNTVGPTTGTNPVAGDYAFGVYWNNQFGDDGVAGAGWSKIATSRVAGAIGRILVQGQLVSGTSHITSTLSGGYGGFQGGAVAVYQDAGGAPAASSLPPIPRWMRQQALLVR